MASEQRRWKVFRSGKCRRVYSSHSDTNPGRDEHSNSNPNTSADNHTGGRAFRIGSDSEKFQ
jgi:hypothetical protein